MTLVATKGHTEAVQILLEREDVDLNSRNRYGRTPLLYAVIGGHEIIVRLSMNKDDAQLDLADGSGRTPLCYARTRKRPGAIKLLEDAYGKRGIEETTRDKVRDY